MQIHVTGLSGDRRQLEPLQRGRNVQTPHEGHAPECTGSVQTLPDIGLSADSPKKQQWYTKKHLKSDS